VKASWLSDQLVVVLLSNALRLKSLPPRTQRRFRLSLDKRMKRLHPETALPQRRRPAKDEPAGPRSGTGRAEIALLRIAADLPFAPVRFRRSLEKRRRRLEPSAQARPISATPRFWWYVGDSIEWLDAHAQLSGVGRVSTELFFAARATATEPPTPCVLRDGALRAATEEDIRGLPARTPSAAGSNQGVAGDARRADAPKAGDHVFFTGLVWTPGFVELFETLVELNIDFSVLVHDLIPIERPDLVGDDYAQSFSLWLPTTVNTANLIFVSSRRVGNEIVRWALLSGLEIKAHIVPIEFGVRRLENAATAAEFAGDPRTAKIEAGFVLSVGTIDRRKNQIFLCRIWRRLVERLGADRAPQLVLAGRDDLGLATSDPLNAPLFQSAKIIVAEGLSDSTLSGLYQACLFTTFPSLIEGYGLPVAESLQYGKLCLCSDLPAIREHAGDLAWYFDPSDEQAALDLVLRAIEDAGGRQDAEARISASFRPREWSETYRAMAEAAARALAEPICQFQPGPYLPKFPGAGPIRPSQALANAEQFCVLDEPEVSILVVNWNASSLTLECIRQIWMNTESIKYEIIVVDNGSSPYELGGLRNLGDGVRLIELGCNRFFGEANNIAAEAARGRYLCLLNNDAFVQPGWLTALVQEISADEVTGGAVGPLFLFPDERVQEAGAVFNPGGYPIRLGRGQRLQDIESIQKKAADYVSAAALLLPRRIFMEAGGFDLAYEPAYYEDADLCLKIHALGRSVICRPDARVVHIEGASTDDDLEAEERKRAIGDLNRDKFVARWGAYLSTRESEELDRLRLSLQLPFKPATQESDKNRTAVVYSPYALTPGGGERYLLTAAAVLAEQYSVTLVTPHPYSRLRVQQLGRLFQLDLSEIGVAPETDLLRGAPPDLMLAMGNHIIPPIIGRGATNLFLCQFPFLMANRPQAEDRASLQSYDGIIVYSRYASAHVHAALSADQLPELEVSVITPPVELIGGDCSAKTRSILSVGRFVLAGHAKRHDALIEAFKWIYDRADAPIELHLAGSSLPEKEHQEYIHSLKNSAKNYPVYFHINCSPEKLESLYREATAYWQGTGIGADLLQEPGQAEHFGISIVEAMSAGAIPFALNSGGPREIIDNGKTGFLCESMDAMRALTLELFSADAKLRAERMTQAARLSAEKYSVERFKQDIRSLMRQFA
jgi:glycosyltransferase involved in cell wall biosynthesis/GT2 family glycosyltransferase